MRNEQELVVETRHLVALILFLILGVAFPLGLAVTPYVRGQPLLLTRENLAVRNYLNDASRWTDALERERVNLENLLSPSRPGVASASVFESSQKARTVRDHLNALAREIERTRVPPAFAALDQATRAAAASVLRLADATLTFVGRADETTRAEAVAAAADAKEKNHRRARGVAGHSVTADELQSTLEQLKQQYDLQIAQLREHLRISEKELADVRRALEQDRLWFLGIAQAFAPAILVEARGDAPYKTLATGDLVALIIAAGGEKFARLTAFREGLTEGQRERIVRHILDSDQTTWADDPELARVRRELEQERAARIAAEQEARTIAAREKQAYAAVEQGQRDLARLKSELAQLQARARTDAPVSKPTARLSNDSTTQPLPRNHPTNELPNELPANVTALLTLLATRGLCERPRLAQILVEEFNLAPDTNHFQINDAFAQAAKLELIETVMPKTETGFGRAPQLVKLSAKSIALARETLHIEPAPSELERLLAAHDTPEHALLILMTRRAFLELYPEPVESVDIFPPPVHLADNKRYEADLLVELASGETLHVECERDTPKNIAQRNEKWSKYFLVTQGKFHVVTPDPKALGNIKTEINSWHIVYGGGKPMVLKMTNLHQLLSGTAREFWTMVR